MIDKLYTKSLLQQWSKGTQILLKLLADLGAVLAGIRLLELEFHGGIHLIFKGKPGSLGNQRVAICESQPTVPLRWQCGFAGKSKSVRRNV